MIDTNQIISIIKLGIAKINTGLMWLANFLGNWAKIDPANIHLILIIILALYSSRKIMLLIYASGEEGRTTTWLLIAGGIFLALKYL